MCVVVALYACCLGRVFVFYKSCIRNASLSWHCIHTVIRIASCCINCIQEYDFVLYMYCSNIVRAAHLYCFHDRAMRIRLFANSPIRFFRSSLYSYWINFVLSVRLRVRRYFWRSVWGARAAFKSVRSSSLPCSSFIVGVILLLDCS